MTKPIQKVKVRHRVVPAFWGESSWPVRIIFRRAAPTFRRLSLSMQAQPTAKRFGWSAASKLTRSGDDPRNGRKPRAGRGDLRRELGCPARAWAPLATFAALPLRCRTSKRLHLQHLFRQPKTSI